MTLYEWCDDLAIQLLLKVASVLSQIICVCSWTLLATHYILLEVAIRGEYCGWVTPNSAMQHENKTGDDQGWTVPKLEDYNISQETGFLCEHPQVPIAIEFVYLCTSCGKSQKSVCRWWCTVYLRTLSCYALFFHVNSCDLFTPGLLPVTQNCGLAITICNACRDRQLAVSSDVI